MTVYFNGDFISLDQHSTTFSTMVEDKGKIVYMGYNTPICYQDAKHIDLDGKAVLPAINSLITINTKGATCEILREGESADFAILDKNITKEENATVLQVFVKGKDTEKPHFPLFG